ncbi:Hypothetical predicted protein [Olea europaea subsp. europaea]|uniref:Uncharacterized protein n=1 Tax=Olea europaea subsp. europaea TaxID=158383 RepID=A0A8S0V626_OLEEU|nr:Hypothetical predicted protein [Olea europaea subsp. europaea]
MRPNGFATPVDLVRSGRLWGAIGINGIIEKGRIDFQQRTEIESEEKKSSTRRTYRLVLAASTIFDANTGDEESHALTRQLPSTNFIPTSRTNVLFKYRDEYMFDIFMFMLGNTMPYYYPDLSYNVGTQLGIAEETLRPSTMGVFPLGFHGPSPPPTNIAGWMSNATHTILYVVVAEVILVSFKIQVLEWLVKILQVILQ